MFSSYDNWKLASPPEDNDPEPLPDEVVCECCAAIVEVPYVMDDEGSWTEGDTDGLLWQDEVGRWFCMDCDEEEVSEMDQARLP